MLSVQSAGDRVRRNDRMPAERFASEDCNPQPHLATKKPAAASSPDRATPAAPAAGIIDPVSSFDVRATEFRSRNPDKVAFTIKASQHLL
jgi:hypothetical protein